jgi:hypothetical protein
MPQSCFHFLISINLKAKADFETGDYSQDSWTIYDYLIEVF